METLACCCRQPRIIVLKRSCRFISKKRLQTVVGVMLTVKVFIAVKHCSIKHKNTFPLYNLSLYLLLTNEVLSYSGCLLCDLVCISKADLLFYPPVKLLGNATAVSTCRVTWLWF